MIHIWLPNPHAPLRVWQDTTQSWQLADNWQEVATLISLQQPSRSKKSEACLYFPSLHLLKLQPDLTAPQLKALGESGRQYLFEDISIASVEDLQIKSQTVGDTTTLYALHASDRDGWMNTAHLAGVDIVALLPDFLLLPNDDLSDKQAIVYQDSDTQLLRYGNHGLAVSHLPLQLSKLDNLTTLILSQNLSLQSQTIVDTVAILPQLTIKPSDSLPTPVSDPTRQWLNFATIKKDTKITPYAKVILTVFSLALLTGLLVDGLRWYHYQKAETQAKTLLKQQYEQWFPNEKYNTRLSMQRQLSGKLVNEQSNENNLMTVLGSIQPVLRQYQINAQSLNYQNNHLQLQLVAKDSDSLNKAVTAMTTQGVTAKLGNVSQNNAVATAPPMNGATQTPPTAQQTVATVDISL